MKIILPQEFFQVIKDKHVLLDTSIFIDAFSHGKEFGMFFNSLKDPQNGITLVTLDNVLIKFLKGSSTEAKLNEKKVYVESIIDTYLPNTKDLIDLTMGLLKEYKIESKDLSITDLLLGAALVKYKENICLLTKDISDFPTRIFDRISYITLLEQNSIRNYGVYSYI